MDFPRRIIPFFIIGLLMAFLASCGGSSHHPESRSFTLSFSPIEDMVFSQNGTIVADALNQLESVSFSIATKTGNVSKPVNVSYSFDYLNQKGLVDEKQKEINFTVFGLYADFENSVTVNLHYADGDVQAQTSAITTAGFVSDAALPAITINSSNEQPPVSFIFVRSLPVSPIIIDADGETRWMPKDPGEEIRASFFDGDSFVVGALRSNAIYRFDWDGSYSAHQIGGSGYGDSHHNIELGKEGLLNTIAFDDGVEIKPESVAIEATKTGGVLRVWDLDTIVANYITANGEDPSAFVMNDFDWCHMNSVIYDAANDDVIMSCREDFVISVDYSTNKINWLLGNPGKFWFTNFPNSLQKLALTVTGVPPVGQHALSISADGSQLMLFNNGKGNIKLPDVGDTLDYSLVSIYDIDPLARTANAVWEFDMDKTIYSDICSSVYRTQSGDMLINYATSESRQVARIMVVNEAKEILYDASIPKRESDNHSCRTAYNIEEISLDGLVIDIAR